MGSLFWGPFADAYGRRISFMCSCGVITIFGWLSGLSRNYEELLTLRFFVGMGVSGSTVPFDIFAEFLPSAVRGRSLMLTNLFWAIGELYVVLAAYMLLPKFGWQGLCFASAAPVTIATIFSFFILPESPRWLITQGRYKEAEDIVNACALHSSTKPKPFTFDPTKNMIRYREQTKQASIDHAVDLRKESEHKNAEQSFCAIVGAHLSHTWKTYSELLTGKKLRGTTFKIGTIWGVFGFSYYGVVLLITRIYQAKVPDSEDSYQLSIPTDSESRSSNAICSFDYTGIAVNTSSEIFAILGLMLSIDTVGRRGSQMGSYGACAISLVVMGTIPIKMQTPSAILVLGYIMRMASMASSSSTWVVTPELYPTKVRATAHSLVNTFARLGALFSPFLVVSKLPVFTVALILGLCDVLAVIAAWSLKETMGKPMDDSGSVKEGSVVEGVELSSITENPLVSGFKKM